MNLYRTYENTAYNRREFIRVAINSVINSTLPEDEYEIIVGQVSEGEKHRLYMTSAVYALPSIYKPFRITLLEAGMHGTPSAITGEGGQTYAAPPNRASLWAKTKPKGLRKHHNNTTHGQGTMEETKPRGKRMGTTTHMEQNTTKIRKTIQRTNMKIVHIHHHYWPMVSGLENVARALAEGMVKLGHEVHVITSNYGTTNKTGEEEINGVHVHRIRSIRLGYPDLTYPLDYPTEVLKDADIVQAYSQNSLFTYILAKKGKRLGKTTSIYYLGVDYLRMYHNPIIRMIGYRYEKYVTEKLVKITDIALTTNKCETEVLKVNYGIESEIIQHGIDDVDALIRAFRRIYSIIRLKT